MCVETTKVRWFKDMNKCLMVQFGQNFHFFLFCYFPDFLLDVIEEKDQLANLYSVILR